MHNLLWHRMPHSESVEIFWPWEQHHETRLALDVHVANCPDCVMEMRAIFDGVGERDMLTIGCEIGDALITELRRAAPVRPAPQPRRSPAGLPSKPATRPRSRPR